MEFYFEDFTEENYRKIINLAKNFDIPFLTYREACGVDKAIIWRHDIDFSVHRSLAIAKIEHEEGVRSTFFVHFNSRFYNVFEKEILEKLIEISKLGHEIGVHFDCEVEEVKTKERLEEQLLFYKQIIEHMLNVEVSAFSFHNPTELILSTYTEEVYAGLYNAYSVKIRERFSYCSDSNGYWRYQRLEDFLEKEFGKNIIVLTHPAWWVPNAMAPRERIQRVIDGRKNCTEKNYDSVLESFGRKNVRK